MLLQLRRDVALGVLHCLLADIVVGNFVAVRVRHFQVIAEHFVEADFQAGDAGAGRFFGLITGDPLLAAGRQFAQAIQLGAWKPARIKPAVAARQRTFVGERRFQLAPEFPAQIQLAFQADSAAGCGGR